MRTLIKRIKCAFKGHDWQFECRSDLLGEVYWRVNCKRCTCGVHGMVNLRTGHLYTTGGRK